MKKRRVVMIPGDGGGGGSTLWFESIKRELEPDGIECVIAQMPDPYKARAEYWLPYMEDELALDENTVVVGHSSGSVAALRYGEAHKLAGVVLVGTYHTDLGYVSERESGYFEAPWQWNKIRQNVDWTAILASPDDPDIPIAEPQLIARELEAEYLELPGEGHFVGKKGAPKREFPEIVALLKRRLKRV